MYLPNLVLENVTDMCNNKDWFEDLDSMKNMEEVFVDCSSTLDSFSLGECNSQDERNYYNRRIVEMDFEPSDKSDYSENESETVTCTSCKLNFSKSEEKETSTRYNLPVSKKKIILILLAITILNVVSESITIIVTLSLHRINNGMVIHESINQKNVWLEWTSWSNCTNSCGDGIKIRNRKCQTQMNQAACIGKNQETQQCRTKSCRQEACCSSVLVDFVGPAFDAQAVLRGNYEFINSSLVYGDIFENKIGSGFYLYKATNGVWGIGSSLSSNNVGIYHQTCLENCPTQCSQNWRYYDDLKNFNVDQSIEVSCKEKKCCDSLSLTSEGLSKEQWSEAFGLYRYLDKDDKGGPIYAHVKFKRYLIRDHIKKNWKIADGYGASRSHYLSRYYQDGYMCPEDAISGDWRFFNKDIGEWNDDGTIRLACNDRSQQTF